MSTRSLIRLCTLSILLFIASGTSHYFVHYYTAGLTEQAQLVEFGYEDDLIYCSHWRPDKFDPTILIEMNTASASYSQLNWSIKYQYRVIQAHLLQHINDINFLDSTGKTALDWAVIQNDYDLCKQLLDKGANANSYGAYDFTALHWAACNDNAKIIDLLIQHGADVNALDDTDNSAMHWAVHYKSMNAAEVLIKHGIDLNTINSPGFSDMNMPADNRVDKILNKHITIDL